MFVRGRSGSFSVEIFDRSRSGYWIIGLGAGNDFHGPLGQALPLPSHVSLARPVLSCTHFFQAPVNAGYDDEEDDGDDDDDVMILCNKSENERSRLHDNDKFELKAMIT